MDFTTEEKGLLTKRFMFLERQLNHVQEFEDFEYAYMKDKKPRVYVDDDSDDTDD